MNQLDPAKLASVDKHGDRISIIPAEVKGFYRRHRTWTQLVLLIIFLGLPWTNTGGHQTILLNIPDREFALFGVLFKAHDVPLLFFILAIAAVGLALVTSIWGRVWCGWACPQTVFIDAVYRKIEIWIEGNYRERRQLRDAPMSFSKLIKVLSKWILFILVSSLIAHSFMAYFIGANELLAMIQKPPSENQNYFLLVVVFSSLFAINFGWFREQFCVIMCPYGRIQSLLLDQKSLAIVYDVERGEPRKGSVFDKSDTPAKIGDCVACNRCVQVCPTGIDIRNGLQMECIACTACADACDEIMEKVKKPKGLIGYQTLDKSPISLKRPRSIIYILVLVMLAVLLATSLWSRQPFHFTLLRNKGIPYSKVLDQNNSEVILNQFHLHLQNQSSEKMQFELSIDFQKPVELTIAEPKLTLNAGESRQWYFFTRVHPSDISSGQLDGTIKVTGKNANQIHTTERGLILLGPKQ